MRRVKELRKPLHTSSPLPNYAEASRDSHSLLGPSPKRKGLKD